MKPRKRKCKIREPGCEIEYLPFNSLQKCCPNPKCAIRQSQIDAERKERKKARVDRDRIKKRSEWLSEAQAAFNAFIRERDKDLPCICCGSYGDDYEPLTGGKWDAGHYLGRGAFPELRFEEMNVHKQLKTCNAGESKYARKGRTVREGYRERLIEKIGLDNVLWLEGPHEPKKYTIEEIKAIKKTYQQALRELKKNNFTKSVDVDK